MTKKKNISGETDALDEELLAAIAKVKGHAVQKAVPQPVSDIYPVSAAAEAAATAAWLKAEKTFWEAENKYWESIKAGTQMPDGSVYLGKYECLSRTFNAFAAPEDLPGSTRTYNDTVKFVARLEKWHGYAGTNYANDRELYAAIRNGRYNGGWVIPPRELVDGKDVDDKETTLDNFVTHKDKFEFKDGMLMVIAGRQDSGSPDWYWSSTEDRDHPDRVWNVNFNNWLGDGSFGLKNNYRHSCRPVRLVELKT